MSLIYYQLSDKQIMKYLHKGSQSQERLDALLSFGKSTSGDIKAALSD